MVSLTARSVVLHICTVVIVLWDHWKCCKGKPVQLQHYLGYLPGILGQELTWKLFNNAWPFLTTCRSLNQSQGQGQSVWQLQMAILIFLHDLCRHVWKNMQLPPPQHPFRAMNGIVIKYSTIRMVFYIMNRYELTLKVLVATIDAQWEGMGDVGSVR